jgi:ribosome-binding protein aMBF1 (putative translation factor)
LARTRRPPIETVKLTVTGPSHQKGKAVEALQPLGFVEVEESIPWRDAFADLRDDQIPGVTLADARAKEGLSQRQLSELTGIPQRHISEMEKGRRTIGRERAKKLARALKVNFRIFL